MPDFLLLHGPDLNLLGTQGSELSAATCLEDIEANCIDTAEELGHRLDCCQSNAEHKLIERIQKAGKNKVAFIIINPGAFTNTSVALRDALLVVDIPFIEIHLSNIFAGEQHRHKSYFSDIAKACLFGFGAFGYELAIHAADRYISKAEEH